MTPELTPFKRLDISPADIIGDTPTYKPAPEQIRPGIFTPGKLTGQMIGRLIQSGVAGVENLNWADIQRLDAKLGRQEVEAALQEAVRLKEETGIAPDIQAIDLAELVRIVRASNRTRKDKILAKQVELARARLYDKIAQSAGALALEAPDSDS